MATWGQLRYELKQFAPGAQLDRLTAALQRAYTEFLEHHSWSGLRAAEPIRTTAEYITGTVTIAAGSQTVTGTDTVWDANWTNREFRIDTGEIYGITFTSATEAELDRAWLGDAVTDSGYKVFQRLYPVYEQVVDMESVLVAADETPLNKRPPRWLDSYRQNRPEHGTPTMWQPGIRTDEADPPSRPTIEFYPIPDEEITYSYAFRFIPIGFTGQNTSDSPLPWVPTNYLINHAKAALAEEILQDFPLADRLQARAHRDLNDAVAAEMRRAGGSRLRMSPAFLASFHSVED